MQDLGSTPAPRRTLYRRSTSQELAPQHITRRRSLVPSGSRQLSRIGTPARALHRHDSVRDDAGSAQEGMDVDQDAVDEIVVERGLKFETIFAKSDELQVTFYAHLPTEVKLLLRNADFCRDAYTGEVDTASGFALVASTDKCFVWNHSQALTGTPTCYIFPCPQDLDPLADTALHALVPYGPTREPGLILLTPGGILHFWDSLGMGLAGGEPSSRSNLPLTADERVTTLTRADPQTFVVSTSIGRLFRLVLAASSGKYLITAHAFNRPTSMYSLSRLLPTFLSSTSQGTEVEVGNINAVALRDRPADNTGRDVWTLINCRVQRWNMRTEGWEELLVDQDVWSLIGPYVVKKFAASISGTELDLDLELLDIKLTGSDELLILISFAGIEDQVAIDIAPQPKRIYAIVGLSYSSGAFRVIEEKIQKVPYQSTSSSGAPMHARMQLLLEGSMIAIQFGDTVALCAPDTEYTDRLELKSASDRTLGIGVPRVGDESTLMVLTAATLMKVSVDAEKVAHFQAATGRANLIKSTMTQAILYGSHPENPLHFSFPPDVDEEALMSGAEQLSQAIMESDTSVIRPNHDLTAQLTHRRERLSFLIKFINDNGVLTKMSQRSRQRLATDAEKLYAASQLWLRHNDILASGGNHYVLAEAVYTYMHDAGEGHHEDFMRAFFRLKVQDLGALLPRVNDIVKRSSYEVTHSLQETLPHANDIILTLLQSATDYRGYNLRVYGIDLPLIEPWASQSRVIDIVSHLFDLTFRLIDSPSSTTTISTPSTTLATLRGQLPELAGVLFSAYAEWCAWLGSPLATSDPTHARVQAEFDERFRQARPVVLDTLRRAGFIDRAFVLAERYRDYGGLAALCHSEREKVYPPDANPYQRRIWQYVEKYKEHFVEEMCAWCIEHGEVRTLFAQEQHHAVFSAYLDKFFASHRHPSVSWLHDIGKGRYGIAANSLLEEAESAGELSAKHLMLSIGKLAYLADALETNSAVDDRIFGAFHDGLDFVSVHDSLLVDLKSALSTSRNRQSIDQQVDVITKAKATKLAVTGRRALQSVFKQLVKRLLQGKALSIEDAADALSLKDNEDEGQLEHYVIALRLLVHAKIPEARKQNAFRSVWRRIYLHDDWRAIRHTVNTTDAEITKRFRHTALYHALVSTIHADPEYSACEGFIIAEPNDALTMPTLSQLQSRWPGMPDVDVEGILGDYEWESAALKELGLEDVVDRIRELAENDWE
ncbi:uncharacterized protein PHACADRAFT_256352 [Phanerochaete carnosa HHB-10118-sp]|uniref:Nucleoporin Nup133/Nup155-like C-terminal domain-containing protein n=1 Tax=Phanerochaete carnosa (strain HHB-10118-sp) TaxID=650164 RepID=K5WYM8_PHACS|nr:uncharacterized protein PHACADRAFT_256352 [Phanerochaete carnosa HHB-10118-sp]EKM55617.1 hypothetical protein PHACADRAFT_256352 [Phanerochaete carnosa HHB-10118-sp]